MFNNQWFRARTIATSAFGALVSLSGSNSSSAAGTESRNGAATDTVYIVGNVRNAATGLGLADVRVTTTLTRSAFAMTNAAGTYRLSVAGARTGSTVELHFSKTGFAPFTREVQLTSREVRIDAVLSAANGNAIAEAKVAEKSRATDAIVAAPPPPSTPQSYPRASSIAAATASVMRTFGATRKDGGAPLPAPSQSQSRVIRDRPMGEQPDWNREQYDRIEDNPFLAVNNNPRSTFSIDVDRASYGNVRRFLNDGKAPPADAVRIEESVNYFPYSLAQPKGADPVAITTEVAPAPWQTKHKLVRIALQARRIESEALPPSNLVFLIDVSGSMDEPDKLPLVKESLRLLVNQLREQDHVALVVYAGNAGLVLPSTSGSNKARIAEAIDRLEAGGSTAGGAGLELAYRVAKQNFMSHGNNRVILATDGDFNVGASSDAAMERLIEGKRSEGTYLTVLGFGTGNIQDAKMEKLAKKGNGNYAYVDNIAEARKTLVHEMGGTLYTVANDVKLQIEFNPAAVSAYRLIGYENRLLRDEDFIDDKKDAGDMGAGHSVTALYEVVPVGVQGTVDIRGADSLRYSKPSESATRGPTNELLYVKLRYKKPGESVSKLMTQVVSARTLENNTSDDFRFAASVASFGMLLRNSEYKGNTNAALVASLAASSLGEDAGGYRAEFVGLVQRWRDLSSKRGFADRER